MISVNFNTGNKKYILNGDENNYIEVCVTDPALISRLDKLVNIEQEIAESEQTMETLDKSIRKRIDEAFDADISSKVFGNKSALTIVETEDGESEFLFASFLGAFIPVIEKDIEEATQKINERSKAEADKILAAVESVEVVSTEIDTKEKTDEEYAEFLAYKKAKEAEKAVNNDDRADSNITNG